MLLETRNTPMGNTARPSVLGRLSLSGAQASPGLLMKALICGEQGNRGWTGPEISLLESAPAEREGLDVQT